MIPGMVPRVLLYAGWALGLVALVSGRSALAIAGGALLIGAALANIAGAIAFRGNRTFLNGILALIGLGWIAYGLA
jgi:hypothetical protein